MISSDFSTRGPDKEQLFWQCRRGVLELDWVLTRFLLEEYDSLVGQEQVQFARLLTQPDLVLMDWLMGTTAADDPAKQRLVQKIRQCKGETGNGRVA